MYCSKCGAKIQEGAEFCSHCGEKMTQASPEREVEAAAPVKNERPKLPLILLAAGAGLALLIFLISWIAYGKVYFFNGYFITVIGWIISFGAMAAGIVMFLLGLKRQDNKADIKRSVIAASTLAAVFAVVLIGSAFVNGAKKSTKSSSYASSSSTIQNAFESCHSTAEHMRAIASYDINGDGNLSSMELELFAKAHPRFANDKAFVAWMKSVAK